MKKLLLFSIIAFIGLSTSINAQNTTFGLKGGLNIANVIGGDADRNNLFSFHVGGFAEFGLSESFSIQPELLYSRQGSEVKNSQKVELDYLAIPVMAKYYLTDKFSIEAGPQMSFLVNDKLDYNDSAIPDSELDAESFDLGINLGVGYKVTSNLITQVRYNYGITPLNENPDLNNSVFQISVGYKFN